MSARLFRAWGHEARTEKGRPHWRYKGPLRPWNTLMLERPAEAGPECVG
jgi:hypothetical protein